MDTFEQILYNNGLAAISYTGHKFFYANTLQADCEFGVENHWSYNKDRREKWYGLACCPPNITRFMASLPLYVYSISNDCIYVNLYAGATSTFTINSNTVEITQKTEYPYFNISTFEFCSHQHIPYSNDLRECAIAVSDNGAYIGWEIFDEYANAGSLANKEIFKKVVEELIGDEISIKTNMPSQGIVTLMKQKSEKRYVNHLMYSY